MRRGRRSALTRWALAVLMGLTVLIFLLGTSRGAAPSSIVTPAATATHAYDGRSSALRFADRRLVAATDPNVSLEAAAPGANSRPADCHRCEQRSALQIHADLPTAAGRINVAASWSLSAITVTRVRQTSETEATDATADAGSTLFHYTSAEPGSVFDKGLLPGSDGNVYLTPDGELSPIQAHIDLGLPGGRGFPSHVFSVDANALSEYLGEDLPAATRVAGMPGGGAGGGWEVPINGPIPPWLLQLVR